MNHTFLLLTLTSLIIGLPNLSLQAQPGDTTAAHRDFQQGLDLSKTQLDSALSYLDRASAGFEKEKYWKRVVEIQLRLAEMCLEADFSYLDSGLSYAQKSMDLCKANPSLAPILTVKSHIVLSLGHGYTGHFNDQIKHSRQAEQLFEELEDKDQYAKDQVLLCYVIAASAYSEGDYHKAYEQYMEGLEILEKSPQPDSAYLVYFNNNAAVALGFIGRYNEQIQQYEKTIPLIRAVFGPENKDLAITFDNLALAYARVGKYDQQFFYHKKAEALFIKSGNELDKLRAYINLNTYYFNRGDFENQRLYIQKGLQLAEDNPNIPATDLAELYSNTGIYYYGIGDFDVAESYFQKSINIYLSPEVNTPLNTVFPHVNLATVYESKKEYQKALAHYNTALDLQKMIGKEQTYAIACDNLGVLYNSLEQYDKAHALLQEALDVMRSLSPNHPRIVNFLNHISLIYRDQGKWAQAQKNIDAALEMGKQANLLFEDPYLTSVYYHQGQLMDVQGRHSEAIEWYKKVLIASFNGYTEESEHVPELDQQKGDPIMTFQALDEMAKSYRALGEDSKALDVYQLLIALTDRMRTRFQKEGSKQNLAEMAYPIYEQAIATSQRLYEKDKNIAELKQAFVFSEKSKSLLLQEAIKKSQARSFKGIPKEILEAERLLKIDRAYLENAYYEEQQIYGEAHPEKLRNMEDQLFSVDRRYDSLLETMAAQYPDYFQLRYPKEMDDPVSAIQQKLNNNECLLSYFWGEADLYCFSIGKQKLELFDITLTEGLADSIWTFNQLIQGGNAEVLRHYSAFAHRLYQRLLAKPLKQLAPGQDRILLITDGLLSHLAFDVLLTRPVEGNTAFRDMPYLIRDYNLFQIPSASLWLGMESRDANANEGLFAGFAPLYQQMEEGEDPKTTEFRSGLQNLSANDDEVLFAQKRLGGQVFLYEAASEYQFKHLENSPAILLLAMHAEVNDKNPLQSHLLFSPLADTIEDGILNAFELYNMQTDAQLAILSACQTGDGQIQRGEGLMSLARAFMYTGCPSIVMSLWKANDKYTAPLMEELFIEIDKGSDLATALRTAKLRYLAQTDQVGTLPANWAGFHLIGDPSPVQKPGNRWGFYLLLAGLLFSTFIIWEIYKSRQKASS